jgi:drug/metabolite transporter (DMT)-like permease
MARAFGPLMANTLKLIFALILMGIYAHTFGQGWKGPGAWLFFLSGIAGFGLGDVFFYLSLPRIGASLSVLLSDSWMSPIGGMIEWLWLGVGIRPQEMLFILVIIIGVGIAVAPSRSNHLLKKHLKIGFLFAFISAFGTSIGAVMSRKAYEMTHSAGMTIDAGTVTYQRLAGGVFICLCLWALRVHFRKPSTMSTRKPKDYLWLALNVISGPMIGVICFQRALETTPSSIVLAIIATVPLAVILLVWWLDKEKPAFYSLIGTAIAVAGVIGLSVCR